MARTNTNSGGGGGGSVNSVTASLPLVSSGGTDPNISINQPDATYIWYSDTLGVLIGDEGFTRDNTNGETQMVQEYDGGDGAGLIILSDNNILPVSGPFMGYSFDDGVDSFLSYVGAIKEGADQSARMVSFNNNSSAYGQLDVFQDQITSMVTNGLDMTSTVHTKDTYIIDSLEDATSNYGRLTVSNTSSSLEFRNNNISPSISNKFYADGDEIYMRSGSSTEQVSTLWMGGNVDMYHLDIVSNDRAAVFLDADTNFEAKLSYYTDGNGRMSSITIDPTGIMTKADSNLFYWRNQDDVTTFNGGGLNDITWDGTSFDGPDNVAYIVTVHEEDALSLACSGLPVGAFQQDEPVTGLTSGAQGFVVMWRADIGQLVIRDVTGGPFQNGETVEGDVSGATQVISTPFNNVTDVFYVAAGGPPTYFYQYSTEQFDIGNGLLVSFASNTGHTDTEYWTWTRTLADTVWMSSVNTTGSININLGDVDNVVNGLQASFDITNSVFQITEAGSQYLLLDVPTGAYSFGDINATFNGIYSQWDSANYLYNLYGNGNRFISMDMSGAYTFQFGDIDTASLGTRINIDAVNGITYIGGIINNTPPPYADDAAAGTGGLVAGDYYQTDGSGAAPLNVAGIVMVKQ